MAVTVSVIWGYDPIKLLNLHKQRVRRVMNGSTWNQVSNKEGKCKRFSGAEVEIPAVQMRRWNCACTLLTRTRKVTHMHYHCTHQTVRIRKV